ncbi:MAG: hypothetical protein M0D55_16405 [Elusimicrobiota bacterium]|nr:MAG: hypothetical protein M0D55_16405 [Elusimicrobiota bacterium]
MNRFAFAMTAILLSTCCYAEQRPYEKSDFSELIRRARNFDRDAIAELAQRGEKAAIIPLREIVDENIPDQPSISSSPVLGRDRHRPGCCGKLKSVTSG